MRDGKVVTIEGVPLFFRDVPSEQGQRKLTEKLLGIKGGRTFTPQEQAEVQAASLVNKELNDELLMSLQRLYDDHDPRRMAGAALVGAIGSGLLGSLFTADKPRPKEQPLEQGAA